MNKKELYKKFKMQIQMREKLLGGKPKSEKLIAGWLKTRERENTIETEKEEIDTTEEAEKKAWSGFKKDEKGLYVDSYQIKGMVKETAKVTKITKKIRGLTGLLQSGFFVYPARIHLGKDEPDGFVEETAVVMGRMGPRSIIKRHDYVEKVKLDFEIRYFDTGVLDSETLHLILEAGQEVGFGTNRHMGGEYGRFKILKFEEIK